MGRRILQKLTAIAAVTAACSRTPTSPTPACDPSLWNHVYDPARLRVVSACLTMTGTVLGEHTNEDGDVDLQVTPDPPYADLVNATNAAKLSGALQVEAVCQATVRTSAEQACAGFKGSVMIPPVHAHVSVTGSYVLDTNHGWMEIHPVSAIQILQ